MQRGDSKGVRSRWEKAHFFRKKNLQEKFQEYRRSPVTPLFPPFERIVIDLSKAEEGAPRVRPMDLLPHARHLCGAHAFSEGSFAARCAQCFCYLCDAPAETCQYWQQHCRAYDDGAAFSALRVDARKARAKKAASCKDQDGLPHLRYYDTSRGAPGAVESLALRVKKGDHVAIHRAGNARITPVAGYGRVHRRNAANPQWVDVVVDDALTTDDGVQLRAKEQLTLCPSFLCRGDAPTVRGKRACPSADPGGAARAAARPRTLGGGAGGQERSQRLLENLNEGGAASAAAPPQSAAAPPLPAYDMNQVVKLQAPLSAAAPLVDWEAYMNRILGKLEVDAQTHPAGGWSPPFFVKKGRGVPWRHIAMLQLGAMVSNNDCLRQSFDDDDFFRTYLGAADLKSISSGMLPCGWKGMVPVRKPDGRFMYTNAKGPMMFPEPNPLERVNPETSRRHYRFNPEAYAALLPILQRYKALARCADDKTMIAAYHRHQKQKKNHRHQKQKKNKKPQQLLLLHPPPHPPPLDDPKVFHEVFKENFEKKQPHEEKKQPHEEELPIGGFQHDLDKCALMVSATAPPFPAAQKAPALQATLPPTELMAPPPMQISSFSFSFSC